MAIQRFETVAADSSWYHGSPNDRLLLDDRALFLTKNRKVAEDYAKGKVVLTGRVTPTEPTVYTISVKSSARILDLRNKAHRDVYDAVRLEYNATKSDPDEWLPNLKSVGVLMSATGLPGYGTAAAMRNVFDRYNGMYVDEGSQGVSLMLFHGKHCARILSKEYV